VRHVFRYLAPEPPGAGREIALSADDGRHLARVVRRRPGDPVELIDAEGRLWPATVLTLEPRATVRVGDGPPRPAPVAPIALYQGLAEWGRLDTLVEKAVELGVWEITLFASERARRVPGPEAWERRRARLARVAEAAARQAGRPPLGALRGLVPFDGVLDAITPGEGYLIDPRGERPLPSAIDTGSAASARVALVVGPDAGFSAAEVDAARAAGLRVAHLGPAVLRAETAAIAAVTLAAAAGWGTA
jgi:16S rRNA (uracil1498-N3)-methyltransferase